MVLSTIDGESVHSRMMSIVSIDRKFYSQTDSNSMKYRQLHRNPNVASCFENTGIRGICTQLGKPSDSISFLEAFRSAYPLSYGKYSMRKDEVLFQVAPLSVKRWVYFEGTAYIEEVDIEKNTYSTYRYD